MNSSNGNAPSTTTTAPTGGTVVGSTVWVNPNTRVTESRLEEIVLETMRKTLHKLSIAQLETVLEMRRREEWL